MKRKTAIRRLMSCGAQRNDAAYILGAIRTMFNCTNADAIRYCIEEHGRPEIIRTEHGFVFGRGNAK